MHSCVKNIHVISVFVLKISVIYQKKNIPWVILHGYSQSCFAYEFRLEKRVTTSEQAKASFSIHRKGCIMLWPWLSIHLFVCPLAIVCVAISCNSFHLNNLKHTTMNLLCLVVHFVISYRSLKVIKNFLPLNF